MEKKKLNEWLRIDKIEATPLPNILPWGEEIGFWTYRVLNTPAQIKLERVMNVITDYKFDTKKVNKISDSCFELFTTDGKKVKLTLNFDKPDEIDGNIITQLTLVDDNKENTYKLFVADDKILIYPFLEKDLNTGFMKMETSISNGFAKPMGDKTLSIWLFNTWLDDEEYVIKKVEKEFKERKIETVMDAYHFLKEILPWQYNTFTIKTSKDKQIDELIRIENGGLKQLELYKEVNGVKVKISEEFDTPSNSETIINLLAQIHGLKQTNNELTRKLNQGE